ncbi:MAG: GAF domain-containing protein [Candidatus Zixiibacteriota bacterium]|nr:MAG: GAF domain-containing protein [candidate division Zixibacteria bacterium]
MTSRKRKNRPDRSEVRSSSDRHSERGSAAVAGEDPAVTESLEARLTQLSDTNRRLKRKIFDLYTVVELSRNFNAVLDYQILLDSFIFTCLGQIGGLKGTIFLRKDGQPGRFYAAMSKGSGGIPGPGQYFETDSKLAEYLSKVNRPALIADLKQDVCTDDERHILRYFGDGIAVPLVYQTRLSGLFVMAEKINGDDFSPDDTEFLSILGNQIAVAIENARLYEGERMATRQLRAAHDQLLRTEKLAALGEMSAKVAHEINNPLGIIKNYLALLQRSLQDNADAPEHIDVIRQEINRIAEIVSQLLETHRSKPVVKDRVDVKEIIGELMIIMERLLDSSGIKVQSSLCDEPAMIAGSTEQLKQVFLNLIVNSRDAMAGGGKLTVSVERPGDEVVISFGDTGPGIPPEIVDHIFDPFFTTKEPGKGTGLGLSVCHGIVRGHNGSISYRNIESGGLFEIRLPAVRQESEHDTAS